MNTPDDHKTIRGISIGLFLLAFAMYMLGITQNNGNMGFFTNATELGIYRVFGYIMMGNLIFYAFLKRSLLERLTVAGAGGVAAILVWFVKPESWGLEFWSLNNLLISAIGAGLVAIATVVGKKESGLTEQNQRKRFIDLAVQTILFQFYVTTLLSFTALLNPETFDPIAFHIDANFGFNSSVVLGKLYSAYPWFAKIMDFSYDWVAQGIIVMYALQCRQKKIPPANILLTWVITVGCALFAYNLCPITGPVYLFGKDFFPNAMPDVNLVTDTIAITSVMYRNGFPSMHIGMCMLMIFAARYQKSFVVSFCVYVLTGLTVLSTLSKGEHYLIDLIVSVPFTMALQVYCTRINAAGNRQKIQAIATGISLWLIWILLVRFGVTIFEAIPGLIWLISILTIGASVYVYRRILPYECWTDLKIEALTDTQDNPNSLTLSRPVLYGMFFVSGFTGLMYEVIFAKELALTFGSMATATYTVLAIYMGGMSIGSWLGGIVMTRNNKRGILLYAVCELAIGLYCIVTPFLFSQVQHLYVVVAQGIEPDNQWLLVLRVLCGSMVLLIPTVLMGMTLPLIATELQNRGDRTGSAISKLYGANTLGAALGALLSGYLILPVLGVFNSTALCAAGSMAVAYFAFKLHKKTNDLGSYPVTLSQETTSTSAPACSNSGLKEIGSTQLRATLVVLFLIGCVTLIMEVNFMQLLAIVAGNSAYAFSLMLATLLMGLGTGSLLIRHAMATKIQPGLLLSLLLLSLACVLLLGIFQWEHLPAKFAWYEFYPYVLTFSGRETVRGLTCWAMMFPPALLIGACYPVALDLATQAGQSNGKSNSLGSAIALNTLGNIVGAIAGGFVLLPMLGTEKSIWSVAVLCLIGGLLIAAASKCIKKPAVVIIFLLTLILYALQPSSWDYTKLASGSNVYFTKQNYGVVVDHIESLDGGLTSVALNRSPEGTEVKTLLTNGKFQGTNALKGEMKAQLGFAVTPLLQTVERNSALVIGYGTGVSSRAIKEAGFKQLDIAELSQDLLTVSNRHFESVNDLISTRPGVRTQITDGRNFLLLQDHKYDLISMEITSIWFAGASSLYNREFYQLAAKRLSQKGVLQQWVQLHHMEPVDMACILSTVRAEFPYVSLYSVGGQGIIIATLQPQNLPESVAINAMQTHPGLMSMFRQVNMVPGDLLNNVLLTPDDIDKLVKVYASTNEFVISTDDNLHLEYSTPKGNALQGKQSLNEMYKFLNQFSSKKNEEKELSVPH